MFCKNCGTQLPETAKFCKKCGTPTSLAQIEDKESTPSSDTNNITNANNIDKTKKDDSEPQKKGRKERKAEKKAQKRLQKEGWSTGRKVRRLFFRLFLLILIIWGIAVALKYYGMISIPIINQNMTENEFKQQMTTENEEIDIDSLKVEHPDADKYYEQNAEMLAEVSAKDSDTVQTEKELKISMADREFKDYPISSEYTIDGEYYQVTDISEDSSDKHPIYQTYYVSSNEELWTIFVINGAVFANPVTYNMQSQLGAQLLISEAETITSYDSVTNKFYETIPNESEVIVKVVDRIDAETLDRLTIGVIDGL